MDKLAADKSKAVQGTCVYAEFARSGATTQIIIVPDGFAQDGTAVSASIIRRTVTTDAPKKQWKFGVLPMPEDAADPMADEDKDTFADERMRYASTLFDQLLRGGWTLVVKPAVIEISRKDYDSIKESKTPTKLLYRVAQCRTALDFPADLVNTL
jgi:hypothetical protein